MSVGSALPQISGQLAQATLFSSGACETQQITCRAGRKSQVQGLPQEHYSVPDPPELGRASEGIQREEWVMANYT